MVPSGYLSSTVTPAIGTSPFALLLISSRTCPAIISDIVGLNDGISVVNLDGDNEGSGVGANVVGDDVGETLGSVVGECVRALVGSGVGAFVGDRVGSGVGE